MIWQIILYILLGLLALIVLLLGVCCVRAAAIKNRGVRPEAPGSGDEAAQKAAQALSEMIQARTINAPDIDPEDVRAEFSRLRDTLERRFPLTFGACEKTLLGDALLLRWRGEDASREAVVLMAHSDVVPATGDWKYPPFSGELAQGRIWGRGALDTKGSLCAIFQAVENLISQGFTPPCDVYIESSNNEETMGNGARDLRDYLTGSGVKLRLVVDEGGAVVSSPLPGLKGRYAMLGIVEKGYANVRFTAKSTGGHASSPPKNSPIARLSAFVCEMEKKPPFKKKISVPMRAMLNGLAPDMSFPMRLVMGNLWLFSPILMAVMPKLSPMAAAMLSTTCAFTMSEGSKAANVLPETASITANLRFIMHQPMEPSLEAVKKVAGKYGLETEVLYAHDCGPYVDTDSAEYKYVSGIARETFPEAGQSAYIMVGATDARHFASVCPASVRFSPLVMDAQQFGSVHGLDENADISSLGRAVRFYELLIKKLDSLYGK